MHFNVSKVCFYSNVNDLIGECHLMRVGGSQISGKYELVIVFAMPNISTAEQRKPVLQGYVKKLRFPCFFIIKQL